MVKTKILLKTVCSGFQDGADIAGIRAAKAHGLITGGWIPKGFRTQSGPKPEYQELYGAKEHSSPLYPPRTELNVKESDGTIRFASNFSSAGEKCTLKNIKWYNKPYLDINIKKPLDHEIVLNWLRENSIKILNIAGNSEETSSGIGEFVENYLKILFEKAENLNQT